MNWLVAIPAWGERCLRQFEEVSYPSIRAALAHAEINAHFLIHTDNSVRLRRAMVGSERATFAAPPVGSNKHYALGVAQQEALDYPFEGAVVLLNADAVCSIEAIKVAERVFNEGWELIVCASPRTLPMDPVPIGARADDLKRWTWRNRHPVIEDCVWGKGKSEALSSIYFELEDGVVSHNFHLHPFAVINSTKDRLRGQLSICGTSDESLPNQFQQREIYIVTDEFALAEISPIDCGISVGTGGRPFLERVRRFKQDQSVTHRRFFDVRIPIIGDCRDTTDLEICKSILE